MDENGYKINNIDITLICEKPKISKYKKFKKSFYYYLTLNLKMLMLKLQQQKNLAF